MGVYKILLRLYNCWHDTYEINFKGKTYIIDPYLYWPINEIINWPEEIINLQKEFNFEWNWKELEKWGKIIITKIEMIYRIMFWVK